ncbi:MAG: choline dehydrogenase [Paraburkholderia fungorum]|nr:choline dehydrogenase [Paraburkholderia fungorum]
MKQAFDYIIVGAGSAGCVLAERLSADPALRICLIEAGPPDASTLIRTPLGVAGLIANPKYNWCFNTEPEPYVDGRRMFWPRGKTLGGSSSINAMVYMRGNAADYDDWAQSIGDSQWSYDALLPLFREHESNERGPDRYHGMDGPLNVADLKDPNPLSEVFVQAGQQIGIPFNPDFNGAAQEGVGLHQVTQKKGQRWSSARAFLDLAHQRKNLTVLTDTRVTKILLEGRRAVGVQLQQDKTGRERFELRCECEVVLCGGAVNSPQLLLLSGIGPAGELAKHGINLNHELPGVGQNLQDHLDYTVMIRDRSRRGIGLALSFVPRAIAGLLRYIFRRRGFLASNVAEAGGFAKLTPQSKLPEVQFHFLPAYLKDHGRKLKWGYGCTLHVCQLRPKSRGFICLKSANPLDDPLIHANYLQHPEDLREMIEGVRLARRIFRAPAFEGINGGEVEPGPAVESDSEIAADIRCRAETIYHPVGTCKMGDDAMAVVDSFLCVRGVKGLRVADASIMPTLIGGNTNAPTMVIAERAARMILARRVVATSTSRKAAEAA